MHTYTRIYTHIITHMAILLWGGSMGEHISTPCEIRCMLSIAWIGLWHHVQYGSIQATK